MQNINIFTAICWCMNIHINIFTQFLPVINDLKKKTYLQNESALFLLKNIATWCLVTLRLHRCGFKTAEQDTKSTRPSTVGLRKVIPSPEYPRPCPMSCITPPLAVLSGRAWWPSMATLTVSCAFLLCGEKVHEPAAFYSMTIGYVF